MSLGYCQTCSKSELDTSLDEFNQNPSKQVVNTKVSQCDHIRKSPSESCPSEGVGGALMTRLSQSGPGTSLRSTGLRGTFLDQAKQTNREEWGKKIPQQ